MTMTRKVAVDTFYVKGHDGTDLAVFVYTGDGPATPRPLIWTYNRYNRASMSPDVLARWVSRFPALRSVVPTSAHRDPVDPLRLEESLADLVHGGYVVAIVDIRGTGSSLGSQTEPFSAAEALDALAVMDWLAAQAFCDGQIGMVGRSYMGANQHLVAGASSGHLSAIMPEMAPFDLYTTVHRGGIFRRDFAASWFADVDRRDKHDDKVAPASPDGAVLLDRAHAQHAANRDLYEMFVRLPFRDSIDPVTRRRPYLTNTPCLDGAGFRDPKVPTYHVAGWFDPFVKDALLWYANIRGPKRLTIGPWAHSGSAGINLGSEYLRWFGRWMGDGVPDERPPIAYYTLNAAPGRRWRFSETWPPPGFRTERMYFAAGRSNTVDSANDGRLVPGETESTTEHDDHDRYVVDYSTTSGRSTQWTNVYGGPYGYPDMRANDVRCLTYTSGPLDHPVEVTGHPVVQLWVMSTADDGDFFVYLEQVSPDGTSTYVCEGELRASHRKLSSPPFDNLGLPYQRHHEADVMAISDEPVHLMFDLSPLSWVFAAGTRIRVAIACTDADNAPAPVLDPAPVVSVHRRGAHASFIDIPVNTDACLPAGA